MNERRGSEVVVRYTEVRRIKGDKFTAMKRRESVQNWSKERS